MKMKLRVCSFVAFSALAAAGCQHRSAPPEVVVHFSSALPVGFAGKLWVDGKEQEISGTTPVEVTVQARQVKYHVMQAADDGTLTVEVRERHHPQVLSRWTASAGPNTPAKDTVSFY